MNPFEARQGLLKLHEAADVLGISVWTLGEWIRKGSPVPYYQMPGAARFFDREQLIEWKASYLRNAPPPKEPIPPDITCLNVDQRLEAERIYREQVERMPRKVNGVDPSPLGELTFEQRMELGKGRTRAFLLTIANELKQKDIPVTYENMKAELDK